MLMFKMFSGFMQIPYCARNIVIKFFFMILCSFDMTQFLSFTIDGETGKIAVSEKERS